MQSTELLIKGNSKFVFLKNTLACDDRLIDPSFISSYALNQNNWLDLSKDKDIYYSFAKVRDFIILEIMMFGGKFIQKQFSILLFVTTNTICYIF